MHRFAHHPLPAAAARCLAPRHPATFANDPDPGLSPDEVLRLSLAHFARHGLAAAAAARDRALAAHTVGKRAEYLRWLAICRTLDPRMALAVTPARARSTPAGKVKIWR